MRVAVALGLLVTVSVLAQEVPQRDESYFPQQMTAEELLYVCASSSLTRVGRERKKYCLGFVSAAEEAARLLAAQSPSTHKHGYCFPEGKTAGYFSEVFMKYASRKTTDLNKPAVLVVIEALENSFTCEK
ncbi:MAG: hypothetical protein JRF07_05050 [Deltaproteobacteria bacterium]|jgi:hypothetical protein|nr:hypothetical protein [Deltaproteobacteria bacterium]